MTPHDIEAAFLDKAAKGGVIIRNLISDGRPHRCDATPRNGVKGSGKGDGVYYLHLDATPTPNGAFKDARSEEDWQIWKPDVAAVLTPGERAELKAKTDRQRQERDAERAAEAAEAARRAADFWNRARDADPAHLYLVRKGILPHGVRQLGERLIVPMKDAGGELRGLQWISPPDDDGRSRKVLKPAGCAVHAGLTGVPIGCRSPQ